MKQSETCSVCKGLKATLGMGNMIQKCRACDGTGIICIKLPFSKNEEDTTPGRKKKKRKKKHKLNHTEEQLNLNNKLKNKLLLNNKQESIVTGWPNHAD